MSGGEDFLYRPVRAGMCTLRDLKDGTLDLQDIILANEALDVEEENRYRITEYTNSHGH
jgi:hypothetical protein